MLDGLAGAVPRDALNIALVLALAFFLGVEREEHKQHEAARYAFGGVRTFPLIGLVSYALALMSAPAFVGWTIGFAVVGGFMLLSYSHRLRAEPAAGVTTEISALVTYTLGGLVQHEHYWIATTLGVVSVLLLELKKGLEGLARHIASDEIVTVAKFLLLSVVILPIVPAREVTAFHVNPFKTWLVVVAVSGVSFASYVAQRILKGRGGVLLSALLGGAYSSTVTTVVLARQAREAGHPHLFAGGILTASGVMYARLLVLLALFNAELAATLLPAFGPLAAVGVLAGWAFSRRPDGGDAAARRHPHEARNPLELGPALLFAGVFLAAFVLTQIVRTHLGRWGVFGLAVLMGVTDVDPFILGVAQGGPAAVTLHVAAVAVVIAAASNDFVKALYAYAFADRTTGREALVLLLGFAALGLVPLWWL